MKRLIWADSLKGILIVLVVFGHAIQYTVGGGCYTNHLWNEIYSFHMPAFMAVSGYFAYRGGGQISCKECNMAKIPAITDSLFVVDNTIYRNE